MSREKHCDWCGEPLGFESTPGELESCGKLECNREVRGMLRQEQQERFGRASDDDFERY